jgi:hypothetical protein
MKTVVVTLLCNEADKLLGMHIGPDAGEIISELLGTDYGYGANDIARTVYAHSGSS